MLKKALLLLTCLAAVYQESAADGLPELAKAAEITAGSLPDGISYYITSNGTHKGFADFSIVQRGWDDPVQARRNLAVLPHFGARRPCDFLSRNGVAMPDGGFVKSRGGNTLYTFPSVPVAEKQVLDSTLLMLVDIASSCPGSQAIIISGDVNVQSTVERLGLFSMTVSHRDLTPLTDNYTWEPSPDASVYFTGNRSSEVASLRISYSSPRTPLANMNTVQPVVTRQYATYLGYILDGRIRDAFRCSGIPLASLEYRYRDSSGSPGNEMYTITVSTSVKRYEDAVRTVAAILADIDTHGVSAAELATAKGRLVSAASRDAGNVKYDNAWYVRRCSDSFLYGATLASEATVNELFARSTLPVEQELPLFNDFAGALLDSRSNLVIGFDKSGISYGDKYLHIFESSWSSVASGESKAPQQRTPCPVPSLAASRSGVKISSETQEPVSGGTLLTLSNGLRVIYKKTDLKGEFRYSWLIRGGYPLVSGLRSGEGAFVVDMLGLSNISGHPADSWFEMLETMGITMKAELSLSDLRLSGEAPKGGLPLLLKSLVSISKARSIGTEAFDWYRSGEKLRLEMNRSSAAGMRYIADSLLSLGYQYSGVKIFKALQDDMPLRAMNYYSAAFSRCCDGVLVFMGDLDEDSFKKQICQYLGELNPAKTGGNARARFAGRQFSGKAELGSSAGSGACVSIVRSSALSLNLSGYSALLCARIVLEDGLAGVLSPLGYSYTVDVKPEFFPQESGTIYIDCKPCPSTSLPEGVEPSDAGTVVSAVERYLSGMASQAVDITAAKAVLLSEFATSLAGTEGRMEAVLTRYSEGKDLVTGYENSVKALAPEMVRTVFESLESGRKVRYIAE